MEELTGAQLELWHLVVFASTVVIGMFKQEISFFFQSFLLLWHKPYTEGTNVQLISPSGEWGDVTIVEYRIEIPFFKKGGVVICHQQEDGVKHLERISLANWKMMRTRVRA